MYRHRRSKSGWMILNCGFPPKNPLVIVSYLLPCLPTPRPIIITFCTTFYTHIIIHTHSYRCRWELLQVLVHHPGRVSSRLGLQVSPDDRWLRLTPYSHTLTASSLVSWSHHECHVFSLMTTLLYLHFVFYSTLWNFMCIVSDFGAIIIFLMSRSYFRRAPARNPQGPRDVAVAAMRQPARCVVTVRTEYDWSCLVLMNTVGPGEHWVGWPEADFNAVSLNSVFRHTTA